MNATLFHRFIAVSSAALAFIFHPFQTMNDSTPSEAQFVLHREAERGHANHGWLDTHHSFSFAGWHDPKKMHFGALRVLNDMTLPGAEALVRIPMTTWRS